MEYDLDEDWIFEWGKFYQQNSCFVKKKIYFESYLSCQQCQRGEIELPVAMNTVNLITTW